MGTRRVRLPGPVAVIPSQKVHAQLAPQLHPLGLIGEFAKASARGALPARIDGDRLVLYTDRHVAWLYPTQLKDAYNLGHASRRTFKDEERLLRGALLLSCPAGWVPFQQTRDVPRGTMSAYWDLLAREWAAGDPPPPPPPLPWQHAAWLDRVTQVVEASRDIEIEKQHAAPPLQYRRKGSAREERHSARGVYTFELVRKAELAAGSIVYLDEQPELRGRVRRVEGRTVVVRFESAIDYRRIPPQGALRVMPGDRIYQAQLDAVETLREGAAAHPALLGNLVDRRFATYRPDRRAQPRDGLDPGQLDAFQRAVTVPDLLLVLGPPGTGKTRTITEIIAACVSRGERVLITSHTNRAVDNVLERLPDGVRAVRVGNEDSMTGHARGFMVETLAEGVRDEITAATDGTASRLAPFNARDNLAERWLGHLTEQLATADTADHDAHRHGAELEALKTGLLAPLADQIAAARQAVGAWQRKADRRGAALVTWTRRHEKAVHGSFLIRWLSGPLLRRCHTVRDDLQRVNAELVRARAADHAVQARATAMLDADPQANKLATLRERAQASCREALGEADKAAKMVDAMLRAALPMPPYQTPADLPDWKHLRENMAETVRIATGRAALLGEWRTNIVDAEQQLQRELVRYADVVAATCIGTATTKLLADLKFDLAIVDEAGQISTPDLLVPLVRAKRGVLVGDHRQLPPFLDDDVRKWSDGLTEMPSDVVKEIGDLLRMSAFERLYAAAPPDNAVMLAVQRRMPETLGRFVSRQFYDGILRTDHPGGHRDPIFRDAFAMVDTGDQPRSTRAERPFRNSEDGNRQGYVNEWEAQLVAALIPVYLRSYSDWAVIVPYRAQADRITKLLGDVLGDAGAVADNVGTVDAFQGGERDLIVYGFTRSNAQGDIGFLRELRRLNVAISRAKRQLVLIGDLETLCAAKDRPFKEHMIALRSHLKTFGDLRRSGDVHTRLKSRAEDE